jgi:UDP-glucose 4-epimerase
MKVLLTGASSFTGMWFARALADAGHEVTSTLTRGLDDYAGVRRKRVDRLPGNLAFHTTFGSPRFVRLVEASSFEVLCHHGAQVGDYRDPDFDVPGAVQLNTNNGRRALAVMKASGLRAVVVTGSVAEPWEGNGGHDEPWRAMYPYGIAKAATAAMFQHWCRDLGLGLGKFVVPNPFGPYEDGRLCAAMVAAWKRGEAAEIPTPSYVRDFIHVDLLAKRYAAFVADIPGNGYAARRPGNYVETVGEFARRYAREIGPRLELKAEVRLLEQVDFSEPMVRVNSYCAADPSWDERRAWDAIAEYYRGA